MGIISQVDGSYVLKDGKVNKVPATDMEAASTPLVGFFEKRRLRKFVIYVQEYEKDKPATHQVGSPYRGLKLLRQFGGKKLIFSLRVMNVYVCFH